MGSIPICISLAIDSSLSIRSLLAVVSFSSTITICFHDNMIGFSTFKTFGSNAEFIVLFGDLIGPICIVVVGLDSTNSERIHC